MLTRPPSAPIRVLGIDTSLRSTGVGILDAAGSRMVSVYYGTVKNPAGRPLSACLLHLQDEIAKLIQTHEPQAVAIEGIFYAKNVKTMLILSHARGAIIAQCARMGLPVYEYEPRRVKMAVAGYGGAEKAQIQKMAKTLLGLHEEPQNDAADALALAITHLHNRTALAALSAEPI
ncbi:MAG TPA: crossover junction endodeoxyribonuclease RuvC [Kiritimatiellia bacterium]|mgnify:FL=1|nr:crossover junction endodeoxyribonuclease RuvC [Kiritimatiellia bacterium]HPS08853.1 crossover junction endodeoxyribonuclease RuvC [Kiritimatiellia bacterium]